MGNNAFAQYSSSTVSFVVKNISPQKKTIRIFNCPILYNTTKDLLKLSGVAEEEIRSSLLKGELRVRLLNGDITIVSSDVNLLQFNENHLSFLRKNGLDTGVMVTNKNSNIINYIDERLIGPINRANRIFFVQNSPFIQNETNKIVVFFNGIRQCLNDDYLILESGGVNTGYDSISLTIVPEPGDIILANYSVLRS